MVLASGDEGTEDTYERKHGYASVRSNLLPQTRFVDERFADVEYDRTRNLTGSAHLATLEHALD
jgi:hypothetical protein